MDTLLATITPRGIIFLVYTQIVRHSFIPTMVTTFWGTDPA